MTAPRSGWLWLSWEHHRRSHELADVLHTELVELRSNTPWVLRSLLLGLRSAGFLARRRPDLLVVQNPSILLTALACALKPWLRYTLVVDRHSNFFEETFESRAVKWKLFHALSRWTVRTADLTIITNEELRRLVTAWGGRGFVLPDRMPALDLARHMPLRGPKNVVFVCTFSPDEPVAEVLQASALLGTGVTLYVTGNPARLAPRWRRAAASNVVFTGFLPEADYQSLLASTDVVLALTTAPNTLLCSAYEAVAVGRPLVVSDHAALTSYFRRGAVPTDNTPAGLAQAITTALARSAELTAEIDVLKEELRDVWARDFALFVSHVEALVAGTCRVL